MNFLTTYPPDISIGEGIAMILFFTGIYLLYAFREIPIIGKIWYVVKIFFTVLLVTLLLGFVKDKVKNEVKDILK